MLQYVAVVTNFAGEVGGAVVIPGIAAGKCGFSSAEETVPVSRGQEKVAAAQINAQVEQPRAWLARAAARVP